jgi:hypothetical protein
VVLVKDNQVGFGVQCNSGGSDSPLWVDAGLQPNSHYKVEVSYNAGTQLAQILVDGQLKASATKTFSYSPAGPVAVMRGAHTGDADVFQGTVSNVVVSTTMSECSALQTARCLGHTGVSACLDLQESPNKHHVMYANADGTAHVEGDDGSTFTCQCATDGTCNGLVGTWSCLDFYDGTVVITDGYDDDYSNATSDDSIALCAEHNPVSMHSSGGDSEQCLPKQAAVDAGWEDGYRGWFDVQGCGKCNDYCRWVGTSGSGGDPSVNLEAENSFWSCRLAGSVDPRTPRSHYQSFSCGKCEAEGASSSEGENPSQSCAELKVPSGTGGGGHSGGHSGGLSCLEPSVSTYDPGHEDQFRGWFDVQGCGKCNDYCRWVEGTGPGGDPSKATQDQVAGSYWSCRLAGSDQPYTPRGLYAEWHHQKCDAQGATTPPDVEVSACEQVSSSNHDAGHEDDFRGWYDAQACGVCNDYCRWVEGVGSGGDPAQSTENAATGSYWSCRLAGGDEAYTPRGQFESWPHAKCQAQGVLSPGDGRQAVCKGPSSSSADPGHDDLYRGWFDVQGCGKCNDYCRWVEGSGSGGDPSVKMDDPTTGSFWSCRAAGGDEPYTARGAFTSWPYQRCDAQSEDAPPNEPCLPVSHSISDPGHDDLYRGWFDIQGCGKCNDYCRWVEGTGSGGDPSVKTDDPATGAFWSCRVAGGDEPYTARGAYTNWTHPKCQAQGAPPDAQVVAGSGGSPACEKESSSHDPGHNDAFRGWYDVQGCGECHDYCRWVEGAASGGDPAIRTNDTAAGSFWSCRLAGSAEAYTARGTYANWTYPKCQAQSATAPQADDRRLKESRSVKESASLVTQLNDPHQDVLSTALEFTAAQAVIQRQKQRAMQQKRRD